MTRGPLQLRGPSDVSKIVKQLRYRVVYYGAVAL
jgi:hypothetical protein